MAAPLGFKTFTTGEVLTAADTNGYLMQGVLVFDDAAARSAAVTSPEEGQTSYLKDTDVIEVYDGLAWVIASGDAPLTDWSLVNAGGTALTGAGTITISGISGANQILALVSGGSGTNSSVFSFRVNADSGSNYSNFGLSLTAGGSYSANNQSAVNTVSGTSIPFGAASNNGNSAVSGYILLSGCNSTGLKTYNLSASAIPATGNGQVAHVLGGTYSGSSAITSISILSTLANFDLGTIYVYTSAL
jgi:hypothetical protein